MGSNLQESSHFWFPIRFYLLLQAVGSGKRDIKDSVIQLSEQLGEEARPYLSVNNPLCFRPQCENLEV